MINRAQLGKTTMMKMDKKKKGYLKGGQVKLDANKDGKISAADFKMLKKKKKKKKKKTTKKGK
jgi:hypothetical protein|tara:strand:- start:747 stop:935 length:189 start_codon:yes stop_codon:yes gene_type:complete